MSVSKTKKKKIGFSTGALEKGNFQSALNWLLHNNIHSVELSALRLEELEPLVNAVESLPINRFTYVSFHAPSAFPKEAERNVINLLSRVVNRYGWNIIIHPDVIRNHRLWRRFGAHLLIENMDRRKAIGRTVDELHILFKRLPNARLCLDLAHARQLDTTLTLLSHLIEKYSNRIAQIHISELDSLCQHQPMSSGAVSDYRTLTSRLHTKIPVIIEAMLDGDRAGLRLNELCWTYSAMHIYQTEDGSKSAKFTEELRKLWGLRQSLSRTETFKIRHLRKKIKTVP